MGIQFGVFSDGTNLIARTPSTGGKFDVSNATFGGDIAHKTHVGYTNSGWNRRTVVASTTDATVTPIFTQACPVGHALAVRAFIVGEQEDASDATAATALGVVVNAAGTTALKGTPLYQIVESAAATNITITANDTTDAIEVNVIGIAAENWAWTAAVEWMLVKTSA